MSSASSHVLGSKEMALGIKEQFKGYPCAHQNFVFILVELKTRLANLSIKKFYWSGLNMIYYLGLHAYLLASYVVSYTCTCICLCATLHTNVTNLCVCTWSAFEAMMFS